MDTSIVNETQFLPYAPRRISKAVRVGNINIGAGAPIVVQAMTNTDTADVSATVAQIATLYRAGAELVRVTVNNKPSAKAIGAIINALEQQNINVPIIGDFHYNGDQLLREFPECARGLAKYRINPGNAGAGDKKHRSFATFVETALQNDKPIRIGVNWGSLDQQVLSRLMDENAQSRHPQPSWAIMRQALVASAYESASLAQNIGLSAERIILSCKVSNVADLIAVYRDLARKGDYPLHLGLTEAGLGDKGIVASTAGIGVLLAEGIGDTIRVSLTPFPNDPREREVVVAQELLQALGLRTFFPSVTACPGCGRTTSVFFQELADRVQKHLRAQMPQWRDRYAGAQTMKVAVMGCVVNGPGESKHANIGISLPGTGESPSAPVFIDGAHTQTLKGEDIAGQFIQLIDDYVRTHYQSAP